PAREAKRADVRRSLMSELPPLEHQQEPYVYDPSRSEIDPAEPSPPEPSPSRRPVRDPDRTRSKARADDARSARTAAREAKHALIGQTVGHRYRIRGILGEGGMGTVYDAEHLGLSRQVAIKVLSPAQ